VVPQEVARPAVLQLEAHERSWRHGPDRRDRLSSCPSDSTT
jgi:hypothetical protein